eukprot:5163393-Amphidinium_carterae.1
MSWLLKANGANAIHILLSKRDHCNLASNREQAHALLDAPLRHLYLALQSNLSRPPEALPSEKLDKQLLRILATWNLEDNFNTHAIRKHDFGQHCTRRLNQMLLE